MKKITLLALAILTTGCHLHDNDVCHYNEYGDIHCHDHHDYTHHSHEEPTTTVVYATGNNGGGSNNNIIVIEETEYCLISSPHYYEPDYCSYDGLECCAWTVDNTEEIWCFYEECGWELISIYTYW
jgi:hypothetical protein